MNERTLPTLDDVNRPFWEGCVQGLLRLQRCEQCLRLRYPIATLCPNCLSTAYSWEKVSGQGEVFSFAVFRHAYNEAWRGRIPYVVGIVQLVEGPRMLTTIVDVGADEVHVGMPLVVAFEPVSAGIAIPTFRPSPAEP